MDGDMKAALILIAMLFGFMFFYGVAVTNGWIVPDLVASK